MQALKEENTLNISKEYAYFKTSQALKKENTSLFLDSDYHCLSYNQLFYL